MDDPQHDVDVDVDAYLEWLGFGGTPDADLATLTELQQLHMTAVPFENLSIALGGGVPFGVEPALDKIIEDGRGGWCFELNSAFAALLQAVGFDVKLLGAAVLLGGPSRRIDHLALEVRAGGVHAGGPLLVDVGFGDGFTRPLPLNEPGPHDDPTGRYQFIGSPEGTTLTKLDDDVPVAQYRFKRVAHRLAQFAGVSEALQAEPGSTWQRGPFATRLLDRGPDRVTLTKNQLKIVREGTIERRPVEIDEWAATLHQWFGIRLDAAEQSALASFAHDIDD